MASRRPPVRSRPGPLGSECARIAQRRGTVSTRRKRMVRLHLRALHQAGIASTRGRSPMGRHRVRTAGMRVRSSPAPLLSSACRTLQSAVARERDREGISLAREGDGPRLASRRLAVERSPCSRLLRRRGAVHRLGGRFSCRHRPREGLLPGTEAMPVRVRLAATDAGLNSICAQIQIHTTICR